ncbi:HPF/RaiA family ribosome-associated protein [Rhodococcus sp. IEGM 1318]|uniref:HPF/RaiA family ribosome-associated protein n=1 Tax=Rhodococcus sp. IEGM 1318 TaxID=3082226 RepID=UPI0029539A66|nr:HPF/RaiA family ribosome-associated protein [Rhodococcus sp. IEGM 1318]MDV8009003.1 ribosomal subunit interface protein [Rhodococcus sp. IEGM 1318]
MQVIINSDHNIEVTEATETEMGSIVGAALARFESRLTRVEVHLRDESGGRSTGDDIECLVEARQEGQQPVSAAGAAATPEDALRAAVQKMVHRLETVFGKLDHRKGSTPMGGESTA